MAYKTDGTANFNFFINRQGPRGPQGIEGEQGFSPSITEGENTAETYTLQVNNKDGSFTTPNLKPQFQDRGGDVVKVDREHDTLYFGTVDIPDAVDLTTDQTIGGNKKFIGNSTFTGTSHFTDDVSITGANLEVRGVLDATSATITNLQVPNSLTSSGVINAVAMNAASIKNNQNNKYYLTQSSITAGDNVTIEETTEGVKINSTDTKYTLPVASSTTLGGIKVGDNLSIAADGTLSATGGSAPDNMVTTDTEQTITGAKTFGKSVYLNSLLIGNSSTFGIKRAKDTSVLEYLMYSNDQLTRFGRASARTVIQGTRIQNGSNKNFLVQGSVTAGDNISIEETTDGIKISSTGGGTGDVTLAGDNSFTGNNTFDGETTFNAHTWTAEQEAVNLNVTSLATMKNVNVSGTLTSNGEINAVAINAAGIKNNQNNKYYLNQASITAGSDNLLITETTDGVQIICNAPTNAQIEALQRLINDLSTKIDNLTNRVVALEEQIDGGVASSIYAPEPQKLQEQVVEGLSINEKINGVSEDVQVNDNGGT